MSNVNKRWATVAVMAAPLLVLVGCSGGGVDGDDHAGAAASSGSPYGGSLGSAEVEQGLQALYDKAMDNGEYEVVLYGPSPAEPIPAAFEARFPDIEVTYDPLHNPERTTKLAAEKASGNHVGDLAVDGRTPIVQMAAADPSYCTSFENRTDVPQDLISVDGQVLNSQNSIFGIMINTDLISEADAPHSWEELIDPKYKGQMVMSNPAVIGSGLSINSELLAPKENADKWGMKIVKGLKKNVALVGSSAQVTSAVIDGTYAISVFAYYPYYYQTLQSAPDAPLKFITFEEGTPYSQSMTCVLATAAHPHAAQLYANWLMTKEGQKVQAEAGNYPTMPDSPGPVGLPGTDEISLLPQLPVEESITGYNSYQKDVQELYGG